MVCCCSGRWSRHDKPRNMRDLRRAGPGERARARAKPRGATTGTAQSFSGCVSPRAGNVPWHQPGSPFLRLNWPARVGRPVATARNGSRFGVGLEPDGPFSKHHSAHSAATKIQQTPPGPELPVPAPGLPLSTGARRRGPCSLNAVLATSPAGEERKASGVTETGHCPEGEHRWAPWEHEPLIEPTRVPHWVRWCRRCSLGEIRRTPRQPDTLDPFVRGEEVFRPRLVQGLTPVSRFGSGARHAMLSSSRAAPGSRFHIPRA